LSVVMNTPTKYGKPPAPNTVRNVQSTLGALFEWAEITYGLRGFEQPTRGLNLGRRVLDTAVRPVKKARFLDGEETDRIAEAAGRIYRPLIEFINATGARSGEARGVRWSDLHLDEPVPFVRFTVQADHDGRLVPNLKHRAPGEYREVPLPADQVEKVRERAESIRSNGRSLEGERLVFPTVHGRPRTGSNLGKALALISGQLGIERVTPHVLRDGYAWRLVGRGVDIATISGLLGHKDVSTTVDAYLDADVPLERQAEAVAQAFALSVKEEAA
jgi:integrase